VAPSLPTLHDGGRARSGLPLLAACLLFLFLEAWIFCYRSKDWDMVLYHQYAQSCCDSSFAEMYARHNIEYPPPAVLLMVATEAVARRLPDCSSLRSVLSEFDRPAAFANFKFVYRLEMAAVGLGIFLLLLGTLRRFLPDESPGERRERLLTFALGLGLLSHSAFDRLDLVLGALLLLALVLLGQRRWFWSFVVLALAIAYKVVPVIVAPMWVMASLADRAGRRGAVLAAAGRGLLLAVLVGCFLVPFALLAGPRCLIFLTYHGERGLEYASTYSGVLGTLYQMAGVQTVLRWSHGSWDLDVPLAPLLTRLAPVLLAVLITGATLMLLRRAAPGRGVEPRGVGTAEFAGHVLLAMLLLLLANKVFSPQYLLWVLPLAPLVPLRGGPRRLFQFGFLGLCLVTALLNPHWMKAVIGPPVPGVPQTYLGPSPFGLSLLLARSAVLLGLLAGLAAHLLIRLRRGAECQEGVITEAGSARFCTPGGPAAGGPVHPATPG
jgi:hypothetical protein